LALVSVLHSTLQGSSGSLAEAILSLANSMVMKTVETHHGSRGKLGEKEATMNSFLDEKGGSGED
jgi:hypothetical protein